MSNRDIRFFLIVIGISGICSYSKAAELNVPSQYPTIQSAIDASVNGNKIIVQPGRYYENIIFKGKNIILTSTDPNNLSIVESTIIDGNRPANPDKSSVVTFANSETKNAVIQGFTITGGYGTLNNSLGVNLHWGGGIYCLNSSPTIKGNIITENHGPMNREDGYGGGIGCVSSNAIITGNIIKSNDTFAGGGISVYSSQPRVFSNLIYDNQAVAGGGVVLLYGGLLLNNTITNNGAQIGGNIFARPNVGSGNNMIVNNIICNAQNAGGLYWDATSEYNAIAYNNIWGNADGDYPDGLNQTGVNHNISQDPMLADVNNNDFHLNPYSPCINAGTNSYTTTGEKDIDGQPRVLSSYIDIGADEFSGYTIRYVNPPSSIQAAINEANDGDIIIVSPGRYYENIDFIGKDLTLTSQNPDAPDVVENTIIDGSRPVNPDNGSVVTFKTGETIAAVLKGFTITGGTGTKTSSTNIGGGGIYCYNASPTILNNIITDNHATTYGGAIWLRSGNTVFLKNNIIKNNSASNGGAIYGIQPSEFYGNIVYNNQAFRGNLYFRSSTIIVNNIIYYNYTSAEGGGIYLKANNSIVLGNTIVGNSSQQGGANLDVQFSDNVSIANNIITEGLNRPGVYFYQATNVTFKYNNVWNNSAGDYEGILNQTDINGNISADPVFASDANNFQLQVSSPCINAGAPDYQSEDGEKDVLGNDRVAAGRVDIGACEYPGNVIPIADAGVDQTFENIPLSVALDGSASYDPLGDTVFYSWRQIKGPKVELDHNDISTPSFAVTQRGIYIFSLVVNDGIIQSNADEVGIIIGCNRAPKADAGTAKYALTSPILLDGTGSYDPDGYGHLTYHWRQVSGPTVQITGSDTAEPLISGFVPNTSIQRCKFELIVSDGARESEPDDVNVIIVPNYTTQQLVISNPPFDPEKPTILAFGGGNCSTGGGITFGGKWSEKANWITVDSYAPAYSRYGNMLIVYLSSVAPDYTQSIQTTGYSTGNMPAMEVAWYINATYKDPRYAVNRVSLLDAVCSNLSSRVSQFHANPVGGEQCWVDNYISNDTQYRRADFISGAFNIICNPYRSHSYPVSRYMSSSLEYGNGGVTAFGYLSVIGKGKNYQLNTASKKYYFSINSSEAIVFYNESLYPGKILAPVTLAGPADGNILDANGAILGCLPCENAVRYELFIGPDEYSMDYKICESNQPIDSFMDTFPFKETYWTVKAYDQFGSSIYADPILIKAENVARPIINQIGREYLTCTGYNLIWQKRVSRTEFEYCFKMKLKNITEYDVNDKTVELACGYDEVKMLNNKVFFKSIPAGQEVVSDDTFIVKIDRLFDIDINDIILQVSQQREGDFSGDGKINIVDLGLLSGNWLQTGSDMPQDLYNDNIVNFRDFVIFTENWSIN